MLADLANIRDRLSVRINLKRPSVPIFYGAFSGFIGAIAGGGTGYFLAAYLKWATESPISFRGTNLLMAIFLAYGDFSISDRRLGRMAYLAQCVVIGAGGSVRRHGRAFIVSTT